MTAADGAKAGRVAVLLGGTSSERAVSLRTGAAILAALARAGRDAAGVDVGDDVGALVRALAQADAAFVALHGRGGEDGTVQGLLELLRIPYTGSGVLASALAMDKLRAKQIFAQAGVPTPAWELLPRAAGAGQGLRALACPVVVKPNREGSSVGLSVVRRDEELPAALAEAFRHDDALVEEFLPGIEVTVGVLDGEPLPVVQVTPGSGVYDYAAKYTAGMTAYAVLPPSALTAELQALAVRAHAALGCRGASRIDFRMDAGGRPAALEANTIPGMTETSLLPKAAAAAGIGFDELVARILGAARLDRDGGGEAR